MVGLSVWESYNKICHGMNFEHNNCCALSLYVDALQH